MSSTTGHPGIEIPARGTSLQPLGLGSARLSPGVLAQVGETFAVALSTLQRSVAALVPAEASQQGLLDAVLIEIGRLEHLGVRIQEFARVLSGEGPLPSERIDLAHAVRETLATWSPRDQVRGVTLAAPSATCDVDVNAAVLEQLLNLALEVALQIGPVVEICPSVQGQAVRPLLTMSVDRARRIGTNDDAEDFGDLHWTLFAQLARAVGLLPQRLAAGRVVTMTLGFPGIEMADDQGPEDSVAAGLPRTAAANGRHVLLIEPQELARVTAYDLLRHAGMRIDSAATLEQALSGLRDGVPDVIVTGLSSDDVRVAAFLSEVRTAQPRLRVIQLVEDDNAFAFSAPGLDSPAQVARHNMARTLVPAVAQELDAAWAA